MNNRALVQLTVRYGPYGEQQKIVAIPISDDMTRELMGGVELSDEPFSILLASPGMFGGKGDARTIRRKTFEMRREIARDIARAMERELVKVFGVNDKVDGYRVDELGEGEREMLRRRGIV